MSVSPFGFGLGEPRVVAVDVAHAELRHALVAAFHLAHGPFQRDHGLLRIGHDRREQMRDAVIDGEFEHLGIDHDQPALLGRHAVEQRQDHGVDGDRLAGAGGAGDQQMRHARQIDDHGFAADGLAKTERQLGGVFVIVLRAEKFAQVNFLARRVWQFDADSVAARHDRDTCGHRAHRACDVVGKTDDARRLDAGRGFEFVERDHRAGARIDDLAAHAEIAEHAFEHGGVGVDHVFRQRGALGYFLRGQQIERRQHEA